MQRLPVADFSPNAFLIGSQKSGTTSLAYLLEQHPDICVSEPKETHYFTHHFDKGPEWYREQFANPDARISLDGSTSYTMAPLSGKGSAARDIFQDVPARVHAASPDAKLIYIMREPVARTYSSYWHSVRTGRESRPLRLALMENPLYLEVSDYMGQLAKWLKYYPKESFLLLLFEDFKDDPQGVMSRCCEFLGVDASVQVRLDEPRNASYVVGPVGKWLYRTERQRPGLMKWLRFFDRSLGFRKIPELMQGSGRIPSISDADRAFIAERLEEQTRALEKTLDVSLARWRESVG